MIELAHKLERIWEEDSGFSRQPLTVVIEKPTVDQDVAINHKSVRDVAILVGILTKIFLPQLIVAPAAQEWKFGHFKEDITEGILSCSDKISLNNINRDMACIALHNRHHVYDAISMGIYGGHVTKNQLPLPKTFLRP